MCSQIQLCIEAASLPPSPLGLGSFISEPFLTLCLPSLAVPEGRLQRTLAHLRFALLRAVSLYQFCQDLLNLLLLSFLILQPLPPFMRFLIHFSLICRWPGASYRLMLFVHLKITKLQKQKQKQNLNNTSNSCFLYNKCKFLRKFTHSWKDS